MHQTRWVHSSLQHSLLLDSYQNIRLTNTATNQPTVFSSKTLRISFKQLFSKKKRPCLPDIPKGSKFPGTFSSSSRRCCWICPLRSRSCSRSMAISCALGRPGRDPGQREKHLFEVQPFSSTVTVSNNTLSQRYLFHHVVFHSCVSYSVNDAVSLSSASLIMYPDFGNHASPY